MLPGYAKHIEIDYKFCGAFGATNNNLGLIGKTENPNLFYFLSVGANGIINAISGAKIIEDLINLLIYFHQFAKIKIIGNKISLIKL